MADKRTGLYIPELDSVVGQLKDDALFPMSQDNLTRKVTARSFRTFLNGDNDEPSEESYYSSSKVEDLFNSVGNRMGNLAIDIANVDARIDQLINSVNANYKTLDDRITTEASNLTTNFDNKLAALNSSLTNTINSLSTDLNNKITALDNKLSGWILYGSAAPTNSTLPAGRLYIQYF